MPQEAMATMIETDARQFAGRDGAGSRLTGSVRKHGTLYVGILYVIAISAVLAFVAKL